MLVILIDNALFLKVSKQKSIVQCLLYNPALYYHTNIMIKVLYMKKCTFILERGLLDFKALTLSTVWGIFQIPLYGDYTISHPRVSSFCETL